MGLEANLLSIFLIKALVSSANSAALNRTSSPIRCFKTDFGASYFLILSAAGFLLLDMTQVYQGLCVTR
jgi:hypothetical protein